jgi:hypothetical protein
VSFDDERALQRAKQRIARLGEVMPRQDTTFCGVPVTPDNFTTQEVIWMLQRTMDDADRAAKMTSEYIKFFRALGGEVNA